MGLLDSMYPGAQQQGQQQNPYASLLTQPGPSWGTSPMLQGRFSSFGGGGFGGGFGGMGGGGMQMMPQAQNPFSNFLTPQGMQMLAKALGGGQQQPNPFSTAIGSGGPNAVWDPGAVPADQLGQAANSLGGSGAGFGGWLRGLIS